MRKVREHVALKSIGGIVLLLVLFSVIVSIIGYYGLTDAMMDQYAEGAFLTAEMAAQFVDADRIENYTVSGGKTTEYQEVWKRLDQICNLTEVTFVYVIVPDRSDYGHITFLFATMDHDQPYEIYEFGYVRETTNDDYRRKYRALYETDAERELVVRDRGYIETESHITALIPLRGKDGETKALLAVQRQIDVLAKARKSYLSRIAVTLLFLLILVIFGESVFLNRTVLRPVKLITKEAVRFSRENAANDKKLREQIPNIDEIGHLAGSIDQMEEQIQSYVENIRQITAEKERINTELSLAAGIQEAVLPGVFPPFPLRHEFDLYAVMDPAREVGGDFYDFFLVDDDHLCLLMADVSGKGIPAALFMMASRTILANNAMMGKTPEQILTDTNAAICSGNREEMFVTVWLGILEISTGKLTAANAGHEYPVLKNADGSYELYKDRHGFVIGGMEGIRYREYELQLQPGSKLFLYTDGVPEATNASEDMYGTDRMVAALNADPDAGPKQTVESVKRSVDQFVKNAEQFDDMTMLCLEYRGKSKNMNEIDVEAVEQNLSRVQDFVDSFLEASDCPAGKRMQIGVAVEEIFINIASYAYAPGTGRVTIRVETSENPATLYITFMDHGVPYNPLAKEDPDITLDAGQRAVGGLGIFMTKKFMDDVIYDYRDGRNILKLVKKL